MAKKIIVKAAKTTKAGAKTIGGKTLNGKKAAKKIVAKKVVVKKAAKKLVVKASVGSATKTAVKKLSAKKIDSAKPKFISHKTNLKVGDKAPFFEGKDQHGVAINSDRLAGKIIILYFYPKDDTPGCTATACSLRDEYKFLSKNNYAVVGISADDEKSHAKFSKKYDLPFPLLADVDKKIMKAFNVWGQKMFMGRIFDGIIRTTFVISPKGIIEQVINSVDTANHAQQILNM
jgi:thioredoxin-dependent peroxiredoxin